MANHPDDPLKPHAEKLLEASKSLQSKLEKASGIRYVNSLDAPHYFVISHQQQSRLSEQLSATLDKFIQQNYRGSKLKTSILILNEIYVLTMVNEFPDQQSAVEFLDKFNDQTSNDNTLSTQKFNIFVITKDNSDILYRTKALDEYLTFFDRNYKIKNQ